MVVLPEPLLQAGNFGLWIKADAHAGLRDHVGAVVIAAAAVGVAAVAALLLLLLLLHVRAQWHAVSLAENALLPVRIGPKKILRR